MEDYLLLPIAIIMLFAGRRFVYHSMNRRDSGSRVARWKADLFVLFAVMTVLNPFLMRLAFMKADFSPGLVAVIYVSLLTACVLVSLTLVRVELQKGAGAKSR